jgi:hypothetical protein
MLSSHFRGGFLRSEVVVDQRGIDVGCARHRAQGRAGPALLGELVAGCGQNSRGEHPTFITRTGCYRLLRHEFHHSVNFILR